MMDQAVVAACRTLPHDVGLVVHHRANFTRARTAPGTTPAPYSDRPDGIFGLGRHGCDDRAEMIHEPASRAGHGIYYASTFVEIVGHVADPCVGHQSDLFP